MQRYTGIELFYEKTESTEMAEFVDFVLAVEDYVP